MTGAVAAIMVESGIGPAEMFPGQDWVGEIDWAWEFARVYDQKHRTQVRDDLRARLVRASGGR